MFNHVKSVACIFFGFLILVLSASDFSGRCFLDFNSWALKIQRTASFNFSVFVS